MKMHLIAAPSDRHPGESRGPFNSHHAANASRAALIQGGPAFAGMTMCGGERGESAMWSVRHAG
jgi:hypothetical protein